MDISAYQHMNIRMSTRGKRPLRNLTPSDKVRAIQRIHNGETKASVSRDIGVPESTLRGWCKNEQKLRFMCRQLGNTEQLPISMLENPPEKRTKYDAHHLVPQKIAGITNFEDLIGYGRLPFNGMDFVANSNNNHSNSGANSIFEKIALTEFIKKSSSIGEAARQVTEPAGDAVHLTAINPSVSANPPIIDYSQLSMMQDHLSLLSLLNPNLMMMSGLGTLGASGSREDTGCDTEKAKTTLHTPDSVDENNGSTKSNTAVLSVKNWAKDPSENVKNGSRSSSSTDSKSHNGNIDNNDTNNNAVKVSKQLVTPTTAPELGNILALLPPSTAMNPDSENSNAALLEWCKVFNASLNFLALAAAAAAFQSPQMPTLAYGESINNMRSEREQPAKNILYKQLTKTEKAVIQNEASNDSYYESEPEDLSVRSPTSKMSSLDNSRSQSPAKSTISNSSAQSDADP